MKPFKWISLDFAQPQRLPRLPLALLAASILAAAAAVAVASLQARALNARSAQAASAPAAPSAAQATPELSPSERRALHALATDLQALQRSIERRLPPGVRLETLSASQTSQDITLKLSAASAQSLLEMPDWLSQEGSAKRWRIQSIVHHSGKQAAYSATVLCAGCWH